MTDRLQDLLRDEAQGIDVPSAPLDRIVRDGRRRRTVRRTRDVIAVVASVVMVVGVGLGAHRLLSDSAGVTLPEPVGPPSSTSVSDGDGTSAGTVTVSGSGAAGEQFGAPVDRVVAAVSGRLGEPSLSVGPERYHRVPGEDRWVRDGSDPMSPGWDFPVASVSCWGGFCLVFGGDDVASLRFRGWELSAQSRWVGPDAEPGAGAGRAPLVRLAGSGIGLGDSWATVHAAYPGTRGGGGEGASLVVKDTPWAGISDGVGAWRLSGQWDYQRPEHVPSGAVVTRLSAGQGPEPGCC